MAAPPTARGLIPLFRSPACIRLYRRGHATPAMAGVRSRDQYPSLFVHQHPVVDEAGQAICMEIPAQRCFIIVLTHPVEEGLPALGHTGVVMEECIQYTGLRLPDMAEPQRKLLQCLTRSAA